MYCRKIWKFDEPSLNNYREALNELDYNSIEKDNDIKLEAEKFTKFILDTADKTIPNKFITVRLSDKSWYGNYL